MRRGAIICTLGTLAAAGGCTATTQSTQTADASELILTNQPISLDEAAQLVRIEPSPYVRAASRRPAAPITLGAGDVLGWRLQHQRAVIALREAEQQGRLRIVIADDNL